MDKSFADILVNGLPMVLLLLVWVFFIRRIGGGKYMNQYQRECLDRMDRQTQALERIAELLEKKV